MKVSLSFSSAVMLVMCAALWSVVRPMVDTSPAFKVIGFNCSFPAILTCLTVLGMFAGLVGLVLATKNALAARRDRAEFGPHKLAIRR